MIAGMSAWTKAEGRIIQELGIRHTPAAKLADSSHRHRGVPALGHAAAQGSIGQPAHHAAMSCPPG
ncbi:hypothetical protein [Thauera sp.]|uniref:hypothetical protein n=1 Tax=Thauera sp. TaxID=1905334 RepID=UPI0039E3F631